MQPQEKAHEASQKYKEGKFILERVQVVALHTSTHDSPAYTALAADDDSSDEFDAC